MCGIRCAESGSFDSQPVEMSGKFNRPKAKHHVVSIHKFATGKTAFNQKKKEVEEQKRNQKSKTLREYAKICKAEGIVSDRVNLELYEGKKAPRNKEGENKGNDQRKQTNPFKDATREAKEKMNEKAKAVEALKVKDAEIKKKNELRETRRRAQMKRTKKGQPILSNQIASILGKLQKNA